jgi:hypothetical protein
MTTPGDMPPKPPPPMAPPPGMPPPMQPPYGGPPGQYGYGAPPPPPKSNAMKWVLIGCGVFAGLGVLCCGGFAVVTYFGIKAAAAQMANLVKPVVEGSETVKADIGPVKSIEPKLQMSAEKRGGVDYARFTFDVIGEKGRGTVYIDVAEQRKGEGTIQVTYRSSQGATTLLGIYHIKDDRLEPVPAND